VDAVAHQGGDAVQHHPADLDGQIAASVHRDDIADPPLVDRLLGQGDAGIEPADVTDHEVAGRLGRRRENLVAVGHRRRHRLFQEHVFAAAQRVDRDVAVVVDVVVTPTTSMSGSASRSW